MAMHTILLPIVGVDSTFLTALVLLAAGFVHGSVGFAFAMISTPILAMWMDLSSAILITLFPTIFINAASIGTIKGWQKMAHRHLPFAFLALAGSVLGTLILVLWDARWMKLLLALMIFLYLVLGKLRVEFNFVNRSPEPPSSPLP
ncbi:TSUP family transporter [Nitratifractor sp.]